MKKQFLITIFLLSLTVVFAQTKPKQKEKPPTQKEMQEMMKEMQEGMNEMSEEDKKEMEKMGVKMPDLKAIQKNISGVTDAQLKKSFDDDNRIVPLKDQKRIASIPPTPSKSGLAGYILNLQNTLSQKLSAEDKKDAETLYQMAKTKKDGNLGNAAIGLWMGKYPVLAVYLMGKACIEDPVDINNANNYAAMLSMLGAEHVSLPILQNLNAQFPGNSTILNNIGQAWFGLGDILKSEKYIDSTIRIYAFHSQANLTKGKIEESKGKKDAAAEAVKRSIKTAYSLDKENRIKKLGKDINSRDIDWLFPMPQDPLGLHRFTWPAYPTDVTRSKIIKLEWNAFIEKCTRAVKELSIKREALEQKAQIENENRVNRIMAAGTNVNINDIMPPFAAKADLKLGYLVKDKDGSMLFKAEKLTRDMANAIVMDAEFQSRESASKEAISKEFDPLIGEGKTNPLKAYCSAINGASNQYLSNTNKNLEETQKAWLDFLIKKTNDYIYYSQYTMWPADFELAKMEAKITWLNAIAGQVVRFRDQGPFCEVKEPEKTSGEKLAEFDDVACKYHSSMSLPFMSITSNCSRLEGKLDIGPIAYTRKVDTDKDVLIGATLAVTVGAKKGWDKGPVAAEVEATITTQIEWNDKQITDWTVKSKVGVSAGSNVGVGDQSIEIVGAEATIGMNGSSVKGSGIFKTLNITNK